MQQLQAYFNHSQLKPTTTKKEIKTLCEEAKQYKLYSVCVNSHNVLSAKSYLLKSDVKICATVGFPFGTSSTKAKVAEAKNAIEDGADEIEMVINLGLLKSMNYVAVYKDIRDVKLAIKNTPLKVIIEIGKLSKNDILRVCQICMDANVDYIKTSTGFSKSGATLIAVKIIKKTVKDKIKIEASQGIKDLDTTLKFITAGANKIGTTHAAKIMEETLQEQIET